MKYPCNQCTHEATSSGNLARHKRAVHEEVKYPCELCDHKATSKGDLAKHKRAVHEGVKYPCRQCDHKATSKGNLARHKRAVHEEVKYPCEQCDLYVLGWFGFGHFCVIRVLIGITGVLAGFWLVLDKFLKILIMVVEDLL